MSENLYSMMIIPDERNSNRIRNIVMTVCQKNKKKSIEPRISMPHISLGRSFYSGRRFIENINDWLELQEPILFSLNKVENFNSGIIYLTSTIKNDILNIKDLYFGIKKNCQSELKGQQNNIDYVPHLTLMRLPSINEIDEIKRDIYHQLKSQQPMDLEINQILVKKKISNNRWEDLKIFNIGETDNKTLYDFEDRNNEYVFDQFGRASVF
jgi:2'-5' RNA ligase